MPTLTGIDQFIADYQLNPDCLRTYYDSQDLESLYTDYLRYNSYARLNEITGIAEYADNSEVMYLWVCVGSRPFEDSAYYELVYCPDIAEKKRKRKMARRKTHTKDISKTEYHNIDTGIVDLVIWRDSKGNILNQYNPNDR